MTSAGFGGTGQAVPATLELRYSSWKLLFWILVCAVFVAVSLWIIAAGGLGDDYQGRGALWIQVLGPRGTEIVFAVFGLGCFTLLVAYLRLLIATGRSAAKVDAGGISVNGVWGRKHLAWSEVRSIALYTTQPAARRIRFIKIEAAGRRDLLVSTSIVAGGAPAIDAWIAGCQRFLEP